MSKITVRGSSDDIIVVEGDLLEEFYPDHDAPGILAFSDGTVLSVAYSEGGFWRIQPFAKGAATYSKTEATDSDHDYSDRVTLEGDIRWVVFGVSYQRIKPRSGVGS